DLADACQTSGNGNDRRSANGVPEEMRNPASRAVPECALANDTSASRSRGVHPGESVMRRIAPVLLLIVSGCGKTPVEPDLAPPVEKSEPLAKEGSGKPD